MIPTSFKESNGYLSAPDGHEEEVMPLAVWQGLAKIRGEDAAGEDTVVPDIPMVYSCWKFTAEELAEVNRTGRVWLGVLGEGMPPVVLLGQSPFEEAIGDSGVCD